MAKKNKSKKPTSIKRKSQPTNSRNWIAALGVFIFAFILYANTLSHEYALDDDLVCKENRFVQKGSSGVKEIFTHSWHEGFMGVPGPYYRPMMLTSYALENQAFGHKPGVYHTFNVIYYALSCSFLFFVITLLWKNKNFHFALAATLLFAAHPLHTEVVANIKGRDEILAFLGLLGAIYGSVQYARKSNVIFLAIGLASYFFAILSKEAALTILGLIPLTLYFFTKSKWEKIGIQTLAFGAVAAIYFLIRKQYINPDPTEFKIFDNSLIAIEGSLERLTTAIGMVGEYFKLLVFPHPLSFDYSYNSFPAMGLTNWKVLLTLAAIGGLIYLTFKGLRSKNPISYSILFFAITFGVTSNILFLIGVSFAERLMYTPLLGFCIAVSILLQKYLIKDNKNIPTTFYAALGVILLLFSIKTFDRNKDWKNDNTLFATGVDTAPNSSRTQSFYGVLHYRKALQASDPNEKKALLDTSVEYLTKSVNTLPSFTETYLHLGGSYAEQNNFPKALEAYHSALKQKPNYRKAIINLGITYYKSKNYNEAFQYLNQAHAATPNDALVNRVLGMTYRDTQQFQKAIEHFERALSAQHSEQHLIDLGMLYEQLGNVEKAKFYNNEIMKLRGIAN